MLHFCLKVHFIWLLIFRCEKSNIHYVDIFFFTAYNKLIALGKQPLCCIVQVRCPSNFQTQSFAVKKTNKKPPQITSMLSTKFFHHSFRQRWLLDTSILDCYKNLCWTSSRRPDVTVWYKRVFCSYCLSFLLLLVHNKQLWRINWGINKLNNSFIYLFIPPLMGVFWVAVTELHHSGS